MLIESGAGEASVIVPETTRVLRLIGSLGDCEITWTEDMDGRMAAVIEKKMEEGVTFFRMKRGVLKRKERIRSASDLKGRTVFIGDEHIDAMFSNGDVKFGRHEGRMHAEGIIRDPEEAARTDTVAAPRPKGG